MAIWNLTVVELLRRLVQEEQAGDYVILWRRYEDGKETRDRMLRTFAELTVHCISRDEPTCRRAKIITPKEGEEVEGKG